MNRRSFLKSLGAIAAAAYAVPAAIANDAVAISLPKLASGVRAASRCEWYNHVRVMVGKDGEDNAAKMAFDISKAVLDRKCAEGWKVAAVKWTELLYVEQSYLQMTVSADLVKT